MPSSIPAQGLTVNIICNSMRTLMTWYPIQSLRPGKLVLLLFSGTVTGRWIGYVNKDGVCAWPEQVQGLRPDAWQEVIADLTRLKAVGLH